MVLGGGGYTIKNVARYWCYETAVAVGVELKDKLSPNDYHKEFGPDYTLNVKPDNNMKNKNTAKEIEEINKCTTDEIEEDKPEVKHGVHPSCK
ncbi:histone deacetylase [Trifolium repens]|nr:histone deacetylase [Trifolium repens]